MTPGHDRTFATTMFAVAAGVVLGVIGLLTAVAVLAGRSDSQWVSLIVLGLGIYACVEANNWRKKRQRR